MFGIMVMGVVPFICLCLVHARRIVCAVYCVIVRVRECSVIHRDAMVLWCGMIGYGVVSSLLYGACADWLFRSGVFEQICVGVSVRVVVRVVVCL